MIILAYGLPGTGKTTFLHDYVREHQALGYRWLAVDHADEWLPGAPHWRGQPPKKLVALEEDEERPDLSEPGVYVFSGREGLDVARIATQWGNAVYVDDELDLVARRSQVLGVGWDESPIRRIVHQGRHLRNDNGEVTECHLLGACRRPQSLHNDVSEQASHVLTFRIQGKRTLDRLLGDSHIEEEDWEAVRNLPNFHYLEWPTHQWKSIPPLGPSPDAAAPIEPGPSREQGTDDDEEDTLALSL